MNQRTRLRASPLRSAHAAAVLVLGTLAASCAAPQSDKRDEQVQAVIERYRQGVAEAMREIRAGEPTVYTFGVSGAAGVDPETGLARKPVATDAVDAGTLWRIVGHNDAARAYRGLPFGPPVP